MKKFISDFFLSWYGIGWAALMFIAVTISCNKSLINNIKGAGFEISFENRVKKLDLLNSDEFKNLKNLNENELKLFLIMGGKDASFYKFTNTSLTNEASKSMYKKLEKDSLLKEQNIGKNTTIITPTIIGEKLHKALVQSVYINLISNDKKIEE